MRDEGRYYAEHLSADGVSVRYTCHQGMVHNFFAMASVIPYACDAMTSAGAAIKQALIPQLPTYKPNMTASV